MHRIDTAGHQGNSFVDADPAQGISGTVVNDEWLNAVQEEVAKLIESAGITLDKSKNDQLTTLFNTHMLRRYDSKDSMVAAANLGRIKVGTVINMIGYQAGWAATESGKPWGGNYFELVDAGDSLSRPSEDLGSVFHLTGGSGGLYLKGLFPNGVHIDQFGAIPGNTITQELQSAFDYVSVTGEELIAFAGKGYLDGQVTYDYVTNKKSLVLRCPGKGTFELIRQFDGAYMIATGGSYADKHERLLLQNVKLNGNRGNGYSGAGVDMSYCSLSNTTKLDLDQHKGMAMLQRVGWDVTHESITCRNSGDASTSTPAIGLADSVEDGCDRIIFINPHFEGNYWSDVSGIVDNGHTHDKIIFSEPKFHGIPTAPHDAFMLDGTGFQYAQINGGSFEQSKKFFSLPGNNNKVKGVDLLLQKGTTEESFSIPGDSNEVDVSVRTGRGFKLSGNNNDVFIHQSSISGDVCLSDTGSNNSKKWFKDGEIQPIFGVTPFSDAGRLNSTYKTADYTASLVDDLIVCGGSWSLTLPELSKAARKVYQVVQISNGATITIDTGDAATINGSATYSLGGTGSYNSVTLVNDGSNWFAL